MKDIVKAALAMEDEVKEPIPAVQQNEQPIITIAKTMDDQQSAVMVGGPLSTLIGKALNVAYAIKDPLENPAMQAGVTPAMETQVNDYIKEASELKSARDSGIKDLLIPDNAKIGVLQGGSVLKDEHGDKTPIEVFNQLSSSGAPEDFIVYVDSTVPSEQAPASANGQYSCVEYGASNVAQESASQGSYAIESYAIVVKLKKL